MTATVSVARRDAGSAAPAPGYELVTPFESCITWPTAAALCAAAPCLPWAARCYRLDS
jgi:hypothetical protein